MLSSRGRAHKADDRRGQALVEFVLVFPLFVLVLVGMIVLGMGVFFQQQVTNAAREAARFAVVHSQTAQCPMSSNLDADESDFVCAGGNPASRWPLMTQHARDRVFGLHPSGVQLSACWSGYWTSVAGIYTDWDAKPVEEDGTVNDFRYCSLPSNDPVRGAIDIDPRTGILIDPSDNTPVLDGDGKPIQEEITCTAPLPLTDASNDMARAWSASWSASANEVTVFACYKWLPPLAGFLLIPDSVTLRAVVSESLQYQQ
jgi:hypothetical protein